MSEPTEFPGQGAFDEQKLARRRAAHALLESVLMKAGVEPDKFAALRQKSEADIEERSAQHMAEADAQSAAMRATVRRDVENWRSAVEQLRTLAATAEPVQRFLLDTATDVSATPGLTLEATQIAPTKNSAKFLLRVTDPGTTQAVTFGFVWQNTSDRTVVVNVDGYLVLDGRCQAFARGGTLLGFRLCHVLVDVSLNIQEVWNQPPTSPIRQGSQDAHALAITANAGGVFDDDESVVRFLFRGFNLQYRQLVVPPQGHVRIEVACTLICFTSDGVGRFIFNNDGQVLAYGVLIGVLP